MRKRSSYKPRPAMPMPPTWGITAEALRELALRERAAVAAMFDGQADAEHYHTLVGAAALALRAIDRAIQKPGAFDADGAKDAKARLQHCGRALLTIGERHQRLGKYGCSGPERAALIELCDLCEQIRQQLPRRLLLDAYADWAKGEPTPIPKEPEHAA